MIPARNEEKTLPVCIASIRKAAARLQDQVEIIVVLNRCTDQTEDAAKAHGCRIERDDSRNLSRIRNAGANAALGDIIVTIDADSIMSANMLQVVERNLSKPGIVGGGCIFITDRLSPGIILSGICILPVILKDYVSGALFYCRKKDFDAIGGFNEELVSVEDIDFARRLKAHGKATGRRFKTIYNAYVITSARKFDVLGDWYLLKHPKFFWTLMHGKSQEVADRFWYEFPR